MERTGLYKKLTLLMDTSPVIFIRNIRLRKAAEMLLQGEKSISEIAVATGFGSSSYFSKCFQKAYGCKPSEYTNKTNEEIS
jgi:transcriptional regulator GlxA family with amidase domain